MWLLSVHSCHILCEPSLAFYTLFKSENWTVKSRFFSFLLTCSCKLSGIFKAVVRCLVLHNFQGLLQKFRLTLCILCNICQFFSWELYLDVLCWRILSKQSIFLACIKNNFLFLTSLKYWALFWWRLRNSFLCILGMDNQKEGRKIGRIAHILVYKTENSDTALACVLFSQQVQEMDVVKMFLFTVEIS